MHNKKIHIGELLLDKKLITQEQLDHAILQQNATGQKLGRVLIDMHFIKEDDLLNLLAKQLDIPFVSLSNFPLKADIVTLLPEFYARHYRAIVLKKENDTYLVGMLDPQDILTIDELSRILNATIQVAIVREEDLLLAIDTMYRRTAEISSYAEELSQEIGENEITVAQLGEGVSATDAPVIKLLQSIFEDAVQVNASDIHIEPDESVLRIRQRIDGVLQEHIIKEKNVIHALTLRLKLIAGINITEKRLPQDGRFSMKIKGKRFDVRLSTLPVQFGESVVMRLLNQSGDLLDLSQIGMPEMILTRLRQLITMPNGLLLITGPTGSGKTTTLYGVLSELNSSETKIITVEDPVEYRIPRINQVQIQSNIDFTFARALRSILRQDPDIIMVGELRDQETVGIAIRAAMTGHLVLSTLHTNDAISSTLRLVDMGAEPYLVASVLRGVLAQRLVRRICKNCAKETTLTPQETVWVESIADDSRANAIFKKGTGCSYCHHTGYKGQIGVFEYLEWDSALAEALRHKDVPAFLAAANQQSTYHPLTVSGLDLAIAGMTTVSEVMRISGDAVTELQTMV